MDKISDELTGQESPDKICLEIGRLASSVSILSLEPRGHLESSRDLGYSRSLRHNRFRYVSHGGVTGSQFVTFVVMLTTLNSNTN